MINYKILKDGKQLFYKNGFIVAEYGSEFITKNINDLQNEIDKRQNKTIAVVYHKEKYFIYNVKYYSKSKKQKARNDALQNRQFAFLDISKNKNILLKQNYYILYKFNQKINDFKYINEFVDLHEIANKIGCSYSNTTHHIKTNIKKLQNNDFINYNNNKYIIIKDYDFIY